MTRLVAAWKVPVVPPKKRAARWRRKPIAPSVRPQVTAVPIAKGAVAAIIARTERAVAKIASAKTPVVSAAKTAAIAAKVARAEPAPVRIASAAIVARNNVS